MTIYFNFFIYLCNVKHFWLIFTFYLFLLLVLPCSDNTECTENESIVQNNSNEHKGHEHEEERCSPFCICECCGISSLSLKPHFVEIEKTIKIVDAEKYTSFYAFIYFKSIIYSIWKPPQI